MANKEVVYTSSSGESKTIDEWASQSGISKHTLLYRINRGLTIDEAIKRGNNSDNSNIHSSSSNDLTGRKFGKLTVLKRCDSKREGEKEWRWVCECDCPDHNIVEVLSHNLLNGHTNNCGCSNKNRPIDMTGMKCGHLTVLEEVKDKSEAPKELRGLGVLWRCECDCPAHTIVIVPGSKLRTKKNLSCGCQSRYSVDGESGTKIYRVYTNMIDRCIYPTNHAYEDYGERGINICDDWKRRKVKGRNVGYFAFKDWALSNGYEENKGLSIDRTDNNSGYSSDNCRFIDMKGQNNNKRSNHILEYDGMKMTCTQMAEYFGIDVNTFKYRIYRGMSVEDAIKTPIRTYELIQSSYGEFHTLKEWAEISGINRSTLSKRINKLKWDIDTALITGATNPDIYNHVSPASVYAMQNPEYVAPPIPYAMYYVDILGRYYTPEEWDTHQAITYDY